MLSSKQPLFYAFGETLKKLDSFQEPIPGLNLKGKQAISTITGGLVSLVVSSIVLSFALLKLDVLLNKQNPDLITNIVDQAFGDEDYYDTAGEDFHLAFGLRGWHDDYSIDDEHYIKWFARVREQVDGVKSQRLLETYRCVDEDFEGFYPPDRLSAKIVEEMRSTNSFFCVDWKEADFKLYGDKLSSASYS